MTEARYVFAIGRTFDPAGLAGIDGAPVHLVAHRDVVAVVSASPSDEAALRARLDRLDELGRGRRGLSHRGGGGRCG